MSDRFWRELLAARATHKWGNFSWLSLSTLIQSANDALAKADGGRIIDTRRMRWVAAQRARGIDMDTPVPLPGAKRVLLLGDPGEMDGSQYVLVRDLAAAEADVLVLMSDVVYPAGDINAWRDAVYLPYLGLPRSAWKQAGAAVGSPVKVPRWHVFATPGNHDWYDGLTGFMFHACEAEPLPEVQFSSVGLSTMQRLVRSGWQHPTRPDRAMLDPLRARTALRWPAGKAPGPMPFQPGPYYAIDVGKVGVGTATQPAMRLVIVDTGVDGSIDVEQARWIRRRLADSPCPKIVITGKPIVVNNRIGGIPINRSPITGANDGLPADLRDLLVERTACGVVATVAGDIHNAQRLVLAGSVQLDSDHPVLKLDKAARQQARARRLAPVQLIAGGGGAYLSATHTIELGEEDRLPLAGTGAPDLDLPSLAHNQFPSREQSAQRFAARVGVLAGIVSIVLGALLVGVAALVLERGSKAAGEDVRIGGSGVDLWSVVGGSYAALAVAGLLGAAVMAWRRRALTRARVLSGGTLVALVASVLVLWEFPIENVPVIAAGIAIAALIPVLPVALPILRAFPALRRLLPLRVLAVAVFGGAGAALTGLAINRFIGDHLTAILFIGVALLAAVAASGRFLVSTLLRKRDEWATKGQHSIARSVIAVGSLWPVTLLVPPLVLLGDRGDNRNVQRLAILILLLEVAVLIVALTGIAVSLLAKSWRYAPRALPWLVLLAVAGGAAAGWLGSEAVFEFTDGLQRLTIAAVTAVGAGLFAVGGVLVTSRLPVPRKTLQKALRSRDGIGAAKGEKVKGRDVFRTMVIASIPGISELAEATTPPFHKSFMTVEPRGDGNRTTAIVFEVYGLDDERDPSAKGATALTTPPALGAPSRGSYLVDKLTIEIR